MNQSKESPFSRVVNIEYVGEPWMIVVPLKIQRIDGKDTHGWQVRHKIEGEESASVFFSDRKIGDALKGLSLACLELAARLRHNPPTHVIVARKATQSNKRNKKLPDGVYGPVFRERKIKIRGSIKDKSMWSYDSSCPVMDPRTGKTHSTTKHYSWTGAERSPKSALKLELATKWRRDNYQVYLENCEKWDVVRNARQIREVERCAREAQKQHKQRERSWK